MASIESVDDAIVCVSFPHHKANVDDHEDPLATRASLRVPLMSLHMRGFCFSDEVLLLAFP